MSVPSPSVSFFYLALFITMVASWITHAVWTIGKLASDGGATAGQLVLGVLGVFVPPIGVIHGYMVWLGY